MARSGVEIEVEIHVVLVFGPELVLFFGPPESYGCTAMAATAPSQRTRVRRAPARARYERETIDAILDEGLVAHLGFAVDGQPYVIPTLHARVGDTVYVHGSAASRAIRTLSGGLPACLTVTLIDAMVLARSAFHHSMNYRSVVVLGEARPVGDPAELLTVLEALTNRLVPGRWDEVRAPNAQELKGTRVLAMTLDEASAKLRTGPPVDDDEDHALDVWAGVIPVALTAGEPRADPQLRAGIAPSARVEAWSPARPR
jgi:nitroimidazol reductase NimA-like FMN-containing flavoprotein (pyridoxamine 5'-phosphate oxidase superfamily)